MNETKVVKSINMPLKTAVRVEKVANRLGIKFHEAVIRMAEAGIEEHEKKVGPLT